MAHNRRFFLKTLAAGMTIVSLPEISPVLGLFSSPGHSEEDLATKLSTLLLGHQSSGPFVAHAKTYIVEAAPHKLLGAPSALLRMLDDVGLDRRFSSCMGYHEASQCRPHFESQEAIWRGRGNSFNSFTGVKRPRSDSDVAIAVGGNIDANNHLTHAAGATQFQDLPAIGLEKRDPDIVRAVKILLNDSLTGAELTQALAVTGKEPVTMDDGVRATRYETPVSSSVYIPRARRTSRVSNAVGLVAANTKKVPNRIYFADVYESA